MQTFKSVVITLLVLAVGYVVWSYIGAHGHGKMPVVNDTSNQLQPNIP